MAQPKQVGILGDGQLARMLALSAHQLGLEPVVFGSRQSSAGKVVAHVLPTIYLSKKNQLSSFVELTFESEFFSAHSKNHQKIKSSKNVFPSVQAMSSLQFRHLQKELLVKHKLPTAPYFELYGPGDLTPFFQTESQNEWVFKKNFGGYDGYGTFFWSKDSHVVLDALTEAPQSQKVPILIAEPLIKFKRELALTAARNKKNEIVFFPLVQTFQKNGQCDYVLGPAHHRELEKFKTKVKSFLKKLNYVGVITFELFDFEDKLLVNEVAPRVHNSAHYTMNATNISQFEMHWRCGLNLPLPEPKLTTPQFVMVNLVGTKNTKSLKAPPAMQGHLHWYGKSESRPRRKLGHLNFCGKNQKSLLNKALSERKKFNL